MAKETITSGSGVFWSAIVTKLNNMFTEIYSTLKVSGTLTNAVVGSTTLASNTTGHNLAGMGYGTLLFNTTGYDNVAIGTLTLRNNTVGSGLVAVGNQALYSNISGYYNVAVGDACLKYTTGERNTSVGSYSGHMNTTGSDNVFIGNRAGYNQTVNNNRLIIDNQDRGNVAAELSNSLVYGVFDAVPANQKLYINGAVGIGTQTLGSYKLKIDGDCYALSLTTPTVNIANGNWGLTLAGSYLRVKCFDGIQFYNTTGSAEVARIVNDTGSLGIGTTAPTSKLQVVGIPVYANNASAVAGGLTAGAFYRTGADPDPLMIVH